MLKDIQETAKQHMMAAKTLVAEEKEIKNRLKAEADKKKAEEKIKEEQEAREHVINIINANDVYYIESVKQFYRELTAKDINRNPILVAQFSKTSELHTAIMLEPKYQSIFFEEIRRQKDSYGQLRTKTNVSFSLSELDQSTLNFGDDVARKLMKIDDNDDKPHHKAFDVLMHTLGGEHELQIRELKKMIAYRYITVRERSSYAPPIPLIIGKGGTGKNILFDEILPEVFNFNYVKSVNTKAFMGEFNSTVYEGAITFLDEFEPKDPKEAWNIVKSSTNPVITCNEKFKPRYKIYNSIWLAIGTNDNRGAIKLANTGEDSEDRRILVLKVKKSLKATAKIDFGFNMDDLKVETSFHAALRNKKEINRWIRDLVAEFESEFFNDDGTVYAFKSAYKGPDYYELVESQEVDWKSLVRETLDEHIVANGETHVKLTEIWNIISEAKDIKEISFPDAYNKKKFYADLKFFIQTDPRLSQTLEYKDDTTRGGEKIKNSIVLKNNKPTSNGSFFDDHSSQSDNNSCDNQDEYRVGLKKIKTSDIGTDFKH